MSSNSIEKNGDIAVLTLKQDLVSSTVNDLRVMILDAIKEDIKNVTINMAGISIIDSMGIGLLISIQNSLAQIDGKLEVVNISTDIMDLFLSMRLDQHFLLKGV